MCKWMGYLHSTYVIPYCGFHGTHYYSLLHGTHMVLTINENRVSTQKVPFTVYEGNMLCYSVFHGTYHL